MVSSRGAGLIGVREQDLLEVCTRAGSMVCRIIIVGAPGAGKSTLARGLAEQLGGPCYPLDPVAFVDERWTPRAPGERSQMIEEIAAQLCWIAEGVHLGWTDPLLAAADYVVWLDPLWWTLLWRAGRAPTRSQRGYQDH
jgi:adenylate kinase family enzyme